MHKQAIKATQVSRENNAFVNKIRYVQGAIKHDIRTKNMSAIEKSLLNVRLLDLDLVIAKSFMKNKVALKTSLRNTLRKLTNEESLSAVTS
tara:strand:- start:64 stop:336 length:273 start_codon:yes stop_codon:yes gene_type:complete